MAFVCNRTEKIAVNRVDGGFYLPFLATESGTWKILIGDDEFDFAAIEGAPLNIPDVLLNNSINLFQIRRPDAIVLNDTCYSANVQYEVLTADYAPIDAAGLIPLEITIGTETEYQDDRLVNAAFVVVQNEEGQIVPVTFDPPSGGFTWSFSDGQKINILFFKSLSTVLPLSS